MFLESVKLFNFRHFEHQLIVQDFSPGINIFIGPNGSGKSSFFTALQILIDGDLNAIKKEIFKKVRPVYTSKSNSYLLIQICLNNSRKLFPIKKKKNYY